MLARSALLLTVLASSADAAPFDDLKGYLASCLRFEMSNPGLRPGSAASSKIRFALDRCGEDVHRLEQADPRRLRGDGGLSPSAKAVILSVLGRGGSVDRRVRD